MLTVALAFFDLLDSFEPALVGLCLVRVVHPRDDQLLHFGQRCHRRAEHEPFSAARSNRRVVCISALRHGPAQVKTAVVPRVI